MFSVSIANGNNDPSNLMFAFSIYDTTNNRTFQASSKLTNFNPSTGDTYRIDIGATIGTVKSVQIRHGYLRTEKMLRRSYNISITTGQKEYSCLTDTDRSEYKTSPLCVWKSNTRSFRKNQSIA